MQMVELRPDSRFDTAQLVNYLDLYAEACFHRPVPQRGGGTVEKLLRFTALDKATPDKRSAPDRRGDFNEIYQEFAADRAREQASRCSQCGVPYCQVHCPLGNNIPDWLMLTAEGRLEEAYEVAAATNNMPEVCGRICPQDRLCEGNCVIEKGFDSVTIGSVEKYITQTPVPQGWGKPPEPLRE